MMQLNTEILDRKSEVNAIIEETNRNDNESYINGGEGDDMYHYTKDEGVLVIKDAGGTNDTLILGNYSFAEIAFKKIDDDLIIHSLINADQIKINNHFTTSAIESLFVDDAKINLTDLGSILNGVVTYDLHF